MWRSIRSNRERRTKGKGRFLSRDLAPAIRYFEDMARLTRSQLIVTPELLGNCRRSPRFPHSSVITFVVRVSYLPSRQIRFPGRFVSIVADSLDDL
jgi:hypothetical protein